MANHYLAYMLRLWQVGEGESAAWRVSLENPHTGECCAFGDCEALFAFIRELTERQAPPAAETDDRAATAQVKSA